MLVSAAAAWGFFFHRTFSSLPIRKILFFPFHIRIISSIPGIPGILFFSGSTFFQKKKRRWPKTCLAACVSLGCDAGKASQRTASTWKSQTTRTPDRFASFNARNNVMFPTIPPTLIQFWALVFCLRLLRRYFCSSYGISNRGLPFEDSCTIQSMRNGFSLSFSFSLISMSCDADMARWQWFKGRGHVLSASSALWKAWYSLGVIVMLLGNIIMPLVLLTNLWNYYLYASGAATTNTIGGSNTYADLKSLSAADVNSQTLLAGTGRAHGFISQPRSLTTSTLISPIIPGVNYPFEYAPLLWFTVLFVVIIHECGHAAAG